jgi:hypothetical protein
VTHKGPEAVSLHALSPHATEDAMHAVVVRVSIDDPEKARQGLREQVIPRVKQSAGFVAGYWTSSDDGHNGVSMVVFEGEDNARQAADRVREGGTPETVTIESVEVREVVESA